MMMVIIFPYKRRQLTGDVSKSVRKVVNIFMRIYYHSKPKLDVPIKASSKTIDANGNTKLELYRSK